MKKFLLLVSLIALSGCWDPKYYFDAGFASDNQDMACGCDMDGKCFINDTENCTIGEWN